MRDMKNDDSGDETWFEQCEPEEAHFWSVFGHWIKGGVECFGNFPTECSRSLPGTRPVQPLKCSTIAVGENWSVIGKW